MAGIEILALEPRLAGLHHVFTEQGIVAGDGDTAAKSLARGAKPGQIADGAVAQIFQGAEN